MSGRMMENGNHRMRDAAAEGSSNGRENKTKTLRRIQQLNFAMIELGLYLNNQPDCEEALALFDKVKCLHDDAKAKYEEAYGPLTYEGVKTKKDGWSWINDPWPWKGEDC